jgi:probable 2-oxoglutarate dehydrogenase E1 component DHKTD1
MFRKDVIVDLICYRRWGHNELDEPGYTQPKMYEKIRKRSSVPELYEKKVENDGVVSQDEAKKFRGAYQRKLEEDLGRVEGFKAASRMLGGKWKGMVWPASQQADHSPSTGVKEAELKKMAIASVTLPDSFVSYLIRSR